MEKIELTAQQKSFMETFGYLSFPGLLDDCIDDIIAAFEKVWERHGGGHDDKKHEWPRAFVHRALYRSERILISAPRRRAHRRYSV
jgi:hypothetical protein